MAEMTAVGGDRHPVVQPGMGHLEDETDVHFRCWPPSSVG